MILNFVLLAAFLGSVVALWYSISRKLPILSTIPEQVILERFNEDSAKIRLFAIHFKTFCREKKYQTELWKFFGKAVYKIHITILRLDNGLVSFLNKARLKSGAANGGGLVEQESAIVTGPSSRLEEVRTRNK